MIHAFGPWTVESRPAQGFPRSGGGPLGPISLLVIGLLMTGLLVALLRTLLRGRDLAERAVASATGSLRASEERFRSLATSAPIGILRAGSFGAVTYANARIADICGRQPEELIGRNWVEAVHPDDLPGLLALVDDKFPDPPLLAASFRVVRPGGEVRNVRMMVAPESETVGNGYVATLEDLTTEVRAREALTYQAFHDGLTGLPNRELFLDRLGLELARSRVGAPDIAVLFIDLDRFKLVNDSLGHEAGDAVLKSVGDRLMHAARAGETVARLGGDEFMVLIRDVHQVDDAAKAATRLLGVLAEPLHCAGLDLIVTGSIGIVVPPAGADAATVLRDADTAMHEAKGAGTNRYVLYSEDLHLQSVTRLGLERELRVALEEKDLQVYYQPVLDPRSGRPISAEALVRWPHRVRGMVPPSEFIPVAEDSGLIQPLGGWVLEQAIAQLARWDGQDDGPRLDVMAVNMSVRQLEDPGTVGMLAGLLDHAGVDPRRLCLEVTESVFMHDAGATRQSLESIRELGVRVAVDDFGTGYSSLRYLSTLPITTVKIDISFVRALRSADDSTPVVKAIIDMAHAMGLRVVAEGVSDECRLAAITDLGCDLAQGFYWSPAVPPEDFALWWRQAELHAVAPA